MIDGFSSGEIRLDTAGLPAEVAVAWSGGADSTALLLLMMKQGFRVQAWHVDHAWRDTSAAEARLLSAQAAQWGIELQVARLPAPSGCNREAEARKGRYACFEAWARSTGITTLCLGHHSDDQAETVCMRLLQGAGISGCRGMQSRRSYGSLELVRPLLHVPAEALKGLLEQAGILWLEDPSNADLTVWRNRIRQRLFPAMSAAGAAPGELFLRWQAQAERLGRQLDDQADRLLAASAADDQCDTSGLSMSWQIWSAATAPLRARMLQKMMARMLGDGATPGRRHILMVEAWTLRGGHGGLDLSRCRLLRCRKHLHLRRASADLSS